MKTFILFTEPIHIIMRHTLSIQVERSIGKGGMVIDRIKTIKMNYIPRTGETIALINKDNHQIYYEVESVWYFPEKKEWKHQIVLYCKVV